MKGKATGRDWRFFNFCFFIAGMYFNYYGPWVLSNTKGNSIAFPWEQAYSLATIQ